MTTEIGLPAVAPSDFSAKNINQTEKFSAKQGQFSARGKCKQKRKIALTENQQELKTYVDDATLYDLISAGKVGVHKNGGRQRKGGRVYDYRQRWRVLRLNSKGREVLAFGTPEGLQSKLAQIGISLCFDHSRPQLSIGRKCQQCEGRKLGGQLNG